MAGKTKTQEVAPESAPETLVRVVPVEGLFLMGVPHIEQEVDAATAAEWIASGAFVAAEVAPAVEPVQEG